MGNPIPKWLSNNLYKGIYPQLWMVDMLGCDVIRALRNTGKTEQYEFKTDKCKMK